MSIPGGRFLMLGVGGPALDAGEAAMFRDLQPAGFILFSRNIVSAEQTRRLTDDLRDVVAETPLIAIDQEGGRVVRTAAIAPPLPSAPALAGSGDDSAIARAADLTGDMLRLLGIDLDLAPVLDLDHFPETANALRGRSWGRDAQQVTTFAGRWNRRLRRRGMGTCAKHFPAGGRAVADPHFDLPSSAATVDDLLREDIIPYTALMPELDAVMTGHVLFPGIDPDHPASLSERVVRGLLRDQLGFDRHLVLTDDLDMEAVTRRYGRGEDARMAIAAGNDLALICHRTDTALAAAAAVATLPAPLLADAWGRIERFRERMGPPPAWSSGKWDGIVRALGELALRFPEEGQGGTAPSPVATY
jgi:beta-N-acetylhexosaminidase